MLLTDAESVYNHPPKVTVIFQTRGPATTVQHVCKVTPFVLYKCIP